MPDLMTPALVQTFAILINSCLEADPTKVVDCGEKLEKVPESLEAHGLFVFDRTYRSDLSAAHPCSGHSEKCHKFGVHISVHHEPRDLDQEQLRIDFDLAEHVLLEWMLLTQANDVLETVLDLILGTNKFELKRLVKNQRSRGKGSQFCCYGRACLEF